MRGSLLVDLITALGAGLLGASVALRLKQSIIIGYILAGIAIGPFTPGLTGRTEATVQLAEVGIVLLMFVIGAQLSFRELVRSSRIAVIGGLLQVALTIGIGYGIGRLLGWGAIESYAFGAIISNSSSAVLGKILSDRGELDSRHAQLGLAWSSLQDISTVGLVAVFALLSPVKRIGLHWLLSFLPALVLSVALVPDRRALSASVRFYAWFALLHVAALAVLALLPLETWQATRLYPRLVFLARAPQLAEAAQPGASGAVLASDSYSGAAILAYHTGQPVPVFGHGSSHARHDDILTDWRKYAGRDLLVLRREAPRAEDYRPYFRQVELRTFEVAGATFHAVLGRGFDYDAYRAGVLNQVRERYYRIPAWLPVGRCYFFERYGAR